MIFQYVGHCLETVLCSPSRLAPNVYVVKNNLELLILLPLTPKCCDNRFLSSNIGFRSYLLNLWLADISVTRYKKNLLGTVDWKKPNTKEGTPSNSCMSLKADISSLH